MHNQRIRILPTVLTLAASSIVAVAFASPAGAAVPGQVVITEWMYNPVRERLRVRRDHEHRRRTGRHDRLLVRRRQSRRGNVARSPALGTLAPGESALIVENPAAAAFRTEWGLDRCRSRVAASNTANLGRNDEINIFNGDTLADRLTYGDQTFAGTIRTARARRAFRRRASRSAPTTSACGSFSAVGDGLGSKASARGDIGSPGTTPLGACGPVTHRRRQRHGQPEHVAVPARTGVGHRSRLPPVRRRGRAARR